MGRGSGHRHGLHAVLGAFDARHAPMEAGLVLVGVEVPPAPLDVVVRGRHRAALRTRETRSARSSSHPCTAFAASSSSTRLTCHGGAIPRMVAYNARSSIAVL